MDEKYDAYEAKIEAQKAELKAKDKRIAALERQLAEALRQNALMRPILIMANAGDDIGTMAWQSAVQEAVDGGVMVGWGE